LQHRVAGPIRDLQHLRVVHAHSTPSWIGQGAVEVRRIEIVLTSNSDQREQRIAPGIGEGGSHPMRGGRFGQTGQSEEGSGVSLIVAGEIDPRRTIPMYSVGGNRGIEPWTPIRTRGKSGKP